MPIVKFKKLYADALLPVKGSKHAACYDVYAHSITTTDTGKIVVGLGFATEIPEGWMGILVPRSNLTKHFWVMNNSYGVIDSDYRGEWKAVFTALGRTRGDDGVELHPMRPDTSFPYNVGDRVAQMYIQPVIYITMEEVDELSDTDRGTGGFGSTGV